MLAAYGRLHDSMMTHFRRRFARQTDQRTGAVMGISLFQTINVTTLFALSRALGFEVRAVDSRVGYLLIFASLLVANGFFVVWRRGAGASSCPETSGVPKNYAISYMVVSVIAFAGSLAFLWYAN